MTIFLPDSGFDISSSFFPLCAALCSLFFIIFSATYWIEKEKKNFRLFITFVKTLSFTHFFRLFLFRAQKKVWHCNSGNFWGSQWSQEVPSTSLSLSFSLLLYLSLFPSPLCLSLPLLLTFSLNLPLSFSHCLFLSVTVTVEFF